MHDTFLPSNDSNRMHRLAPGRDGHRVSFGLRDEKGMALLTVLLVTAAIFTLSVFGARSAQIELKIAHNDMLARQALNAAEAGINHIYSVIKSDGGQLNNYLENGGTGGALSS